MKINSLLTTALVAVTALYALPASARPASVEVRLSARVPTICRVEFPQSARSSDQGYDLGTMSEFCNQPTGYRVVLRHPAGLSDARLIVGGSAIPLSSGSQTVVVDSDGPAIKSNAVMVEFGGAAPDVSQLSFAAEAKGATY